MIIWLLKLRITPAYAGNTEIDNDITMGDGDHPRLRGEYEALENNENLEWGSPPPTRGIRGT